MLDWAVGGYMMFVGVTAIIAGMATARDLKLLKFSIKSETDVKQKWDDHDVNNNGTLDVKELAAFVSDAGITMTTNEIASTYMALDKNFDERISYEEFYMWWMSDQHGQSSNEMSV